MKSFYQLACLATVAVALLGYTPDVSAVSVSTQPKEAALFKRDPKKTKKGAKGKPSKSGKGRKASGNGKRTKKYSCYLKSDKSSKGRVTIDWGFTTGDATWACDAWNSACGNGGGCFAKDDVIM